MNASELMTELQKMIAGGRWNHYGTGESRQREGPLRKTCMRFHLGHVTVSKAKTWRSAIEVRKRCVKCRHTFTLRVSRC